MSATPRSSSPATAHLNINLPESFKPFEILISPYVLEVIPKAVHERKLFFSRFFGWVKDHPLLLTCGTLGACLGGLVFSPSLADNYAGFFALRH